MSILMTGVMALGYLGTKLNPWYKPPEKEYLRYTVPKKKPRDRSYRRKDPNVPHLTLHNLRAEAEDINSRADEILSRNDSAFHTAETWDELRTLYREADAMLEDIASGARI